MSSSTVEAQILRTATRRLALLTAASITVVVLVVGAVAALIVWREQQSEARTALRTAVLDLDDLTRSPATIGVWVREADGTVRRSPEAPAWLPIRSQLDIVTPGGRARVETEVNVGSDRFHLLTLRDGGRVVQAETGTAPQERERSRLLSGLVVAELIGLALSLLLGGLLARRAVAPLATAMARQRRFVADASHELRTPLTLLSTRAQLLERRLRLPADVRSGNGGASPSTSSSRHVPSDGPHAESVALVEDTRRLAGVVDDLLLSASLPEQPDRRQPVDLVLLARAATSGAAAHAAENGVTVRGPDQVAEPIVVPGAAGPLRRVMDALIDNAISHSRPGGHVTVVAAPGPPATLQVIDDGTGIDPAVATRLFDRFAHGSHGARGAGRRHFGLGLALVREVVVAHGGEIEARATPGGGATFIVTFPA